MEHIDMMGNLCNLCTTRIHIKHAAPSKSKAMSYWEQRMLSLHAKPSEWLLLEIIKCLKCTSCPGYWASHEACRIWLSRWKDYTSFWLLMTYINMAKNALLSAYQGNRLSYNCLCLHSTIGDLKLSTYLSFSLQSVNSLAMSSCMACIWACCFNGKSLKASCWVQLANFSFTSLSSSRLSAFLLAPPFAWK